MGKAGRTIFEKIRSVMVTTLEVVVTNGEVSVRLARGVSVEAARLSLLTELAQDATAAIRAGISFQHGDGTRHFVNPLTVADPKVLQAIGDDISRRGGIRVAVALRSSP